MSLRFKLLLPGLVIWSLAAAAAWWPGTATTPGLGPWLLLAAAMLWLGWQGWAHERWLHGARKAVRAALAGERAPHPLAPDWRDTVSAIERLHGDLAQERSAREQLVMQSQQVQDALQVSEQRYVLAVRAANDGLWEWDLVAERVSFSPRWVYLFGLDGSEAVPFEAWPERLHPDDRAAALQALNAHVEGRSERFESVHRLLHADGGYRWVLSRGAALRRASGSAYRVVGLDTDITRLKRIEGIVDAIAQGTTGQSGPDFFRALVQHFARALHVNTAFVTECLDQPPTRARTLAFWREGGFDADFEYDIDGTPCERVMREGRLCFYRRDLATFFNCDDHEQSYLGLPIFARNGVVIGHLAFVDSAPMDDDMLLEAVYRVFTARAGVEIELVQTLRRLEAATV